MPKLYGVNASPFVRKVRVALEEKGVAYDHEPVMPINVSEEYKKISPLGKIPTFDDDGKIVNDSSVILAYLDKTRPEPSLYPTEAYAFARALWFEEYADGGMVSVIGGKIFFPKVVEPMFFKREPDMAAIEKAVAEEMPAFFDYLESQLEQGAETLVPGQFTVGDIGVGSHLVNFRHAGYDVDAERWPKLRHWLDATHGRPSFAKLIEEERAQFPRG